MSAFLCVVFCMLGMYCCPPHEQVTEIIEPVQEATSAVIILHGAGDNGPVMKGIMEGHIGNFSQFPNTRFIFPTAMAIRLDIFPWKGQVLNLWYNATGCKRDALEDMETMDNSAAQITKLVEEQVASGISHDRICVVGHSSGGFMAMHFGYEYVKNLGCIGAISFFLPTSSALYKKLASEENEIGKKVPPLYASVGRFDYIFHSSWTDDTVEVFRSAGVRVSYNPQWFMGHYMNQDAVEGLFSFIKQRIM